ncbi:hypothetical protein VIGAN_07026900 [Vigna angularis var. angularis]|uniref:Uncharacterized protein n=1 Tax=Vigna angularis var. angularis TaxID=157739 RepID=A0A0S3SFT9_PHAAN|nr:hypothetical protein VIGAN_07026900 [Vigna angularis var. angularis]
MRYNTTLTYSQISLLLFDYLIPLISLFASLIWYHELVVDPSHIFYARFSFQSGKLASNLFSPNLNQTEFQNFLRR